jgi:hypothetical protein
MLVVLTVDILACLRYLGDTGKLRLAAFQFFTFFSIRLTSTIKSMFFSCLFSFVLVLFSLQR